MNAIERGRRKFLKKSTALAGLAVGAMQSPTVPQSVLAGRAYGQRSRFETSVRENYAPEGHSPIQEQTGIITPSALHYVVTHGYDPPEIDPRQHSLLLHGLVDRPLIFTMEELKRLPSVSRIHFIECAGNTSPLELGEREEHSLHARVDQLQRMDRRAALAVARGSRLAERGKLDRR